MACSTVSDLQRPLHQTGHCIRHALRVHTGCRVHTGRREHSSLQGAKQVLSRTNGVFTWLAGVRHRCCMILVATPTRTLTALTDTTRFMLLHDSRTLLSNPSVCSGPNWPNSWPSSRDRRSSEALCTQLNSVLPSWAPGV